MVFALIILSSILLVSASPSRRAVLHDKRFTVPNHFISKGVASLEEPITLSLNIESRDRAGLEAKLLAAATPGSSSFRKWLSQDEVESHVSPFPTALDTVQRWLLSNGVDNVDRGAGASNWITINVPISKANELLSTTYESFQHEATGRVLNRVMEYSLPSDVAPFIKAIYPTTSFDVYKDQPSSAQESIPEVAPPESTYEKRQASCGGVVTPTCVLSLYGIPSNLRVSNQSRVGIAGMFSNSISMEDLSLFLQNYRSDANSDTKPKILSVDGTANNEADPGTEGTMDIQWSLGLAPQIPNEYFLIANKTGTNPYLDIAKYLLAQTSPPQVFTVSYGMASESRLSPSLTQALCDTYMQLAARGVSVLWATGDSGVAANPINNCTSRDQFVATFPTCPYVTLVGATQDVPEKGALLSAGGFSNYYPTQSWQSSAVNGYLTQLGDTYAGRFNRTGRAYPDVSAMGSQMRYVKKGWVSDFTGSGTSLSSPVIAAMIALLNGELLAAGKPVLGFLNPWLYSRPEMFNDITSGNNPGCGTSGFPATQGWDPVTGLGSPNYPRMRAAAGL